MARNLAQRLDRLERLAAALLTADTSPVYLRDCDPVPDGVDWASSTFCKKEPELSRTFQVRS